MPFINELQEAVYISRIKHLKFTHLMDLQKSISQREITVTVLSYIMENFELPCVYFIQSYSSISEKSNMILIIRSLFDSSPFGLISLYI